MSTADGPEYRQRAATAALLRDCGNMSAVDLSTKLMPSEGNNMTAEMPVYDREYSVDCVLPPTEDDVDFDDIMFVRAAQDACSAYPGDVEVSVVEDDELGREVLELIGQNAEVVMPVNSILPMLVLHVKSDSRFFWVSLEIVDNSKCFRTIVVSNRNTIVSVDDDVATLPAVRGGGWQRLCLELPRLVHNAFGTGLLSTVRIRVRGSISIAKVYLQGQDYSDAELPVHLRALS